MVANMNSSMIFPFNHYPSDNPAVQGLGTPRIAMQPMELSTNWHPGGIPFLFLRRESQMVVHGDGNRSFCPLNTWDDCKQK